MAIKNTFDYSPLLGQLVRVPSDLREPVLTAIRQGANNMIAGGKTSLLQNTPPYNAGARGNAAKAQGEGAIKRDLLGGKKRAGIFTVLSDSLIEQAETLGTGNIRLFATKTGDVYGTESALFEPHASINQMRVHHKRYFKNGKMSQAGGRDRTIGRWKFVDKMVVSKSSMDAYRQHIQSRVGMFAASQMGGAIQLGGSSKVPAWVRRHPIAGGARWVVNDRVMLCEMHFEPIFAEPDVRRRLDYVRRYAQNAFNRRLPYIVKAVLRKRSSGVRV